MSAARTWLAVSKVEQRGLEQETFKNEGSWLSPMPLMQIAPTVQVVATTSHVRVLGLALCQPSKQNGKNLKNKQ